MSKFEKIKNDFTILNQQVNGHDLIYFDSAASAQKPNVVIEAISDYYRSCNSNVHRGSHFLSEKSTDMFEQAREKVCSFFNAEFSKEIIWTHSATESINILALSIQQSGMLVDGDEIIVTQLEHHSNFLPWQRLAKVLNLNLVICPVNVNGDIDVDIFKKLITDKTKLVSVTHISNVLGSVVPVGKLVELCKQANPNIFFHVDGAQAAPHMKVDFQDLVIDSYTVSGQKLFAGSGTGVLYINSKWHNKLSPVFLGGGMVDKVGVNSSTWREFPGCFEAGTPNMAGCISIGKAIDYLNNLGMDNILQYEKKLTKYFLEKAAELDYFNLVKTPIDQAAVFSFNIEGAHAQDLGILLDKKGVAIRVGHHCCQPLMEWLGVSATARASLSFYNTTEEIDKFFEAVESVYKIIS